MTLELEPATRLVNVLTTVLNVCCVCAALATAMQLLHQAAIVGLMQRSSRTWLTGLNRDATIQRKSTNRPSSRVALHNSVTE
jgi:hypothetical protein